MLARCRQDVGKIKILVPPESWEGESVPGLSPKFWWFSGILSFLGLTIHHLDICLHLFMAFLLSANFSLFIRTSHHSGSFHSAILAPSLPWWRQHFSFTLIFALWYFHGAVPFSCLISDTGSGVYLIVLYIYIYIYIYLYSGLFLDFSLSLVLSNWILIWFSAIFFLFVLLAFFFFFYILGCIGLKFPQVWKICENFFF